MSLYVENIHRVFRGNGTSCQKIYFQKGRGKIISTVLTTFL